MIHLTFTSCVFKGRTKEPGRVCRSRLTRRNPVKKEAILTRLRGKKHTADSRARNRGRGEPRTARETASNNPSPVPTFTLPTRSPTRSLPGSLPDICSVGIFSGSRRNRAPSAPQPRGGEGEAAQQPVTKRH